MIQNRTVLLGIVLLICFAISFSGVSAQDAGQCLTLAQTAFANLEEGCSSAPGNAACFGMAAETNGESSFNTMGDTISLDEMSLVRTSALDLDSGSWGMARLNVHANVPLSISETGLAMFLIGDAEIENAVDPNDAFVPAQPVTVQALVGANLRSVPSTDGRVIESAPVGTELLADGVSADRAWLHVVYGDTVAWVSSQIVAATNGEISSLPILLNNTRTLMQSFYLKTGNDVSDCSTESPSMLVIQSPQGTNASILVNGADLRFNDTIVLRILPDNVMQLVVLAGSATNGIFSVPEGFTMTLQLSEDGKSPDGAWTGLRPITDDERNFLAILERMPESVLYNALAVPTQEEVATTLASLNRANAGAVQTVSIGGRSCGGFQPTSPFDGLAFGQTTFYWDSAPEATQYRLNIYTDGELAKSETIEAFSTTVTTDTSSGAIGDGTGYSWNVEALRNSEVICRSGTVSLLRESAPQRAGGGGGGGGDDGGGGNSCDWCG